MTPTLENIWTDFAGRLGQFIRTRVADPAAAEDILQDVFVKIQAKIAQLKDPAKLQSWLFLLTRNAIIDHYRARKDMTEVPETLPSEPPEDDAELEGLKASFRRMIYSLPEPYRDALVLTEFEGLTQKELASRLGISISGAKSRVQRGREQLKVMLHECCTFEFDRRGKVIDCTPREKGGCQECQGPAQAHW
jgi:RNA polymerase sigma-70 factor (ECF subfamily)